jgi:hypothetical protein
VKYEYLHTHRSSDGDLCDAVLALDVDRDGTNIRLLDPVCPGCGATFSADAGRCIEERCAQEIADRMDEKKAYEREMMGSAYGAEEWL